MPGVASIGARPRFTPLNARVNHCHPLAESLEFYGFPYLGVDLVKNRIFTTMVQDRPAGTFGYACEIEWSKERTEDLAFTTGSFTLAIGHSATGTGQRNAFARGQYTTDTNNNGWQIYQMSGPLTRFVMFRNNGVANYAMDATRKSYQGAVVCTANGTTKRIFLDGRQENALTTGNQLPLNGAGALSINPDPSNSVSVACAWSRELSTNEIAMFTADPFCLLSY